MSLLLDILAATLFSLGTYLILQRKLSRVIIGLSLLSHGANVLLISSGDVGIPPLIGSGDPSEFSDPLPQALALTTIVITFGVTALLLAMAYRSWQLSHDDEVEDDVTDRSVGLGGWSDKEVTDEELAMREPLGPDDSAEPGAPIEGVLGRDPVKDESAGR